MVERAALEKRYTRKGIEGSNPSLSARFMTNSLIQLIGIAAMTCVLWSFQQNKRSGILILLIVGQLLFIFHYGLLSAWSAVAVNLVGIMRGIIFYLKPRYKLLQFDQWLYLFIVLFALAGILTWKGPRSLLVVIAMCVEAVGLWRNQPKQIRWYLLATRPFFFTYSLLVGSYAGMLADIAFSLSIVVGMWRFDRKPAIVKK